MPNYYANLPAPEFRNALLDLSPVNNALSGVRQQNNENRNALLQQQQMDMRKEEQTYQRGRDAKQDDLQLKTVWGKRAQAVAQQAKTDPQGAAATWQNLLRQHPNPSALSPEYLDVNRGPAMIMAEAGIFNDPRDSRMKDLEIQKTQAEIGKLNRSGGDAEAPSNVREYQYFNSLPPDEQQRYLTMKRAEKYLDVGTGYVQPNPVAPGQNVRTVPKDLAGAERDKELGTAIGKAEGAAPSDLQAAKDALYAIDSIRNDPNMDWGVGLASPLGNMIPKTPGYDFQNKVDQAKSGAFLTAIQSMRGLGALSNAEGDTATKAVTRMNTATSKEAFLSALNDYERIVKNGKAKADGILAQRRARETQSAPPAQSAPQAAPAARPRAVNPQTGQTIEFDGQQWIEVR